MKLEIIDAGVLKIPKESCIICMEGATQEQLEQFKAKVELLVPKNSKNKLYTNKKIEPLKVKTKVSLDGGKTLYDAEYKEEGE